MKGKPVHADCLLRWRCWQLETDTWTLMRGSQPARNFLTVIIKIFNSLRTIEKIVAPI
ncbi:hypothetical protein PAHAL_3G514200 [Panicum hallii]|uniref:Uncharacterized protein n=1 Tax=Panicum hallii TaxID=206008 RepID=A0A2T8KM64_9POAL|nr:hypothetical protein PAHAL_3G514200 [Panicum hallii]